MAKSQSSARWLMEHSSDQYVKQAREQGLRSRAAYKLQEIHDKTHLFRSGMTVVDLGAAPGGWSQLAREQVGECGCVLALDILPMEPIPGVTFIQGDFTEQPALDALQSVTADKAVDLVLSDMAPNMSGTRSVDQPRAMYLAELALDLATRVLAPDGLFLVKLFQGEGFDAFRSQTQNLFSQVMIKKPQASRSRSRETYLLAKGFKNASCIPTTQSLPIEV